MDDRTRDVVGRIASVRAFLVWGPHQTETIIAQSRRALEYLHPDNLPFRTAAALTLGHAYVLLGDRAGARQALTEVTAISAASGNTIYEILGSIGLGFLQEADNQLGLAVVTYRHAIELAAGLPFPFVCEAHLGLARVHYQWNDLDGARQHGEQSLQLAQQIADTDRTVACEVLLARLALARGDAAGAAVILAEADQAARQHDFVLQVPEVAAAQVLAFLRQGDVAAAAHVALAHELPLSHARVHLAKGDPTGALGVLEAYRRRMAEKAWADEELKALVLLAVAFDAAGERPRAVEVLDEALALAEPGGFIRIFVDEGAPMARLLYQALSQGVHPDYVRHLLAAFPASGREQAAPSRAVAAAIGLAEPLSSRELEVLDLIAAGLTNQQIAARLYVSLHTVKSHARNIYAKLGVSSRTQAAATGRALGLLPPSRSPGA
jgi:LuxR family maltose regulon positive regulatory protein